MSPGIGICKGLPWEKDITDGISAGGNGSQAQS